MRFPSSPRPIPASRLSCRASAPPEDAPFLAAGRACHHGRAPWMRFPSSPRPIPASRLSCRASAPPEDAPFLAAGRACHHGRAPWILYIPRPRMTFPFSPKGDPPSLRVGSGLVHFAERPSPDLLLPCFSSYRYAVKALFQAGRRSRVYPFPAGTPRRVNPRLGKAAAGGNRKRDAGGNKRPAREADRLRQARPRAGLVIRSHPRGFGEGPVNPRFRCSPARNR